MRGRSGMSRTSFFCDYNLWEGDIGQAYIVKIPSEGCY